MSASGPAQRPGAQSQIIVVGLSLLSTALCAFMCADGVRLARLGLPWAAAPAAVAPPLSPNPTAGASAAPLTATPALAATLHPLLPTATLALAPVGVLPQGRPCPADRVTIDAAEPESGAAVPIGRGALAVTVSFCLQSASSARLVVTVVSAEEQPQTLPFGGPAIVQQGDGAFTQSLDWKAAAWSPGLAGRYRLVAALTAGDTGAVLASAFGGLYLLETP